MANVYFSKDFEKILEQIDFSKLGNNVGIKVHFGEKGCTTYTNPELVKKVYEKIISFGKKATLIECNVLYKGSRTIASEHIETAKSHGFDFAPIDILDGEFGQEYIEVPVNGLIKSAKLGAGLTKYDSMVVISHFKGHPMEGFGGALKNIGMGLGSRAGKLAMHAGVCPIVNDKKCTSCKKCIENCNFNAISIIDGKARIDDKKCSGCAMCIAVCPNSAVKIPWQASTSEELCKKTIDYAQAVLKTIPNSIFINLLINITPECDCFDYSQKTIMPDIGFLYSNDAVAIDSASLGLADLYSNGNFLKINNIDKNIQIDYADSRRIGSKNYGLVEID